MTLSASSLAAMLNAELVDDPVYDGFELQWFDDAEHGTGLLAFLSRRDGRVVDYYCAPGLRLDREGYHIGGGTGAWVDTEFEVARLRVGPDGVDAEVAFTDVDGRAVRVRVDDRDGRRRRPAALLAPVSSGILEPTALMIVWMPRFDLVRATGGPIEVGIDGRQVLVGRLPGARWHRHVLVKYAAPVLTVDVARQHDGPLADLPPATTTRGDDGAGGTGVATVRAEAVGAASGTGPAPVARLAFTPAFPDLDALPDGARRHGRWEVGVDAATITGGTWTAHRTGDVVEVGLDVTQRWRPRGLPLLMRVVTRVVRLFRTWPTTYRWRGTVTLGPAPQLVGGWERTSMAGMDAYRQATGSAPATG